MGAILNCNSKKFEPVLKSKSRNTRLSQGKTNPKEVKFSPYFLTVLNNSKKERKGFNERMQQYSQQMQLETGDKVKSCKNSIWASVNSVNNSFCTEKNGRRSMKRQES
mmetsp:Transcript_3090/g.2966  ORF Transcript_3090/g.2966 Transcript_3090/m.2966 type:complete len:108 (-) Transcript_3090:244-567(-)